jgi:Tfp pilus assembly protein PilP
MKKTIVWLFAWGFLCGASVLLIPQEKTRITDAEKEILSELQSSLPTYDPAGRRDPFKNLLAGKEIKEKTLGAGALQLSIDDINLIGIVKYKKKFTAILSGPQGFPYYFEVGDKLADGFILAINDSQVIFRKINERGIPLSKPKDIVKEINPEER